MRRSAARMKNKNSLIFHFLPVNQARTRLKPKNPARKLQPRKRRGVPPSPRANCVRSTRQRDQKGESQRGRSPLWPVFAYFLLARK